ncbi:GLUG motif-containing protein, partial [Roseburia inulinivorans]
NIKNVGVVDSYFKGNDHVGGVCGNNAGTITNCYNAGNLTAIEPSATIGGICGYNNGGTVTNCYNTGTVTATGSVASVGGVCGCSTAPILNCYNIGTVTATSSGADISGICGYNFGPITNCYYLADTEDENGGKTAAQFASGEIAYLLSQGCSTGVGDDTVTYDGSIWGQALGENGDTYPVLDITKKVYQVDKYDGCEGKPGSSTKVYSNQSTSIYEEHKYEADATDSTKHKCSICNGTEEHSFAYELVENGNAIKVTCSECGATYTVKLTQPAATSDEKIVYDGTEKKAGTAIDSGNTGIETIPENAITYAVVTNGTPSTYSTAAPKNAGTYKAKLTLGTGDNRVSIEINFTIEKAASPTIAGEEKSYAYSVGSDGKTIGVDIAGKLPMDRGTTTYAVVKTDTEQLLSEVAVDTTGNLTYKVNQVDSTKVGKTAIITVTASMENYENAEYTLTISSITDKKTIEIKSGNTVSVDGSNVLIYGEKISKLTLGNTVFVEAGTDDVIEGILSWSNPDEIPAAGTTQAGWVFRPADSRHYAELTGTAAITVAKATPTVVTVPTVAEREYNPDVVLTDSDMTGGSVTGADGRELAGTWSFTGTNIVPTVNNTGYQAVFTPSDTANYNVVDTKITITVNKAAQAPNMPQTAMAPAHSTKKVGNITLPDNWSWQEADRDTALADGVAVTATAVYTGADKGNYETESVSITITRSKCDHTHTEIRNQQEATCKKEGYTGDTYCKDCGEKLVTGTATGKKPHMVGTPATCVSKAVCGVCGETFGEVDATNHVHTTVKNRKEATCTQTGYTGDTYCTDCNKLLSTGKELAALGHDYKATVTKQPTTTEEGVRTYTCTRCNSSYTESIAKLPEEQHTHNYTGSITKEATCTEAGVRTYTCSCGDSYTENIPATGHSYVSKVTKAATTTEEGIMTYTCSKCGHSFTQPIAKLKSDDSSKDNGSQNQKPQTGTDNGNQNQEPQPDTDKGKEKGDSIKPYIKDDSGKEGWDVIKPQLGEAKSGDSVTVAMNGTTVVPKDVIDSIKGKDTTLVLDMGNGLSWKINGKDITDAAGDIDFGVTVGADAGKSIPVDVIDNVTGERSSMNLTLAYDGEFGFTATLTINMESKNAGLYANLFYYNEQTGELEFISAGQIDADGNAELAFTHASDYTIVIDTAVMNDEIVTSTESTETSGDETIQASKEDDVKADTWNPIIIIIGICIVLAVLGAVIFVRKKSHSEEK